MTNFLARRFSVSRRFQRLLTHIGILSLFAFSLPSCSFLPATPKVATETRSDDQHSLHYSTTDLTALAPRTANADARPIPVETLYALLVAEMAGQRQHYDIALANYLKQAQQTQSPEIAERATRIALFVGAKRIAQQALNIWLQTDPDNPSAQQVAAQIYIEAGDYSRALGHIVKLQELTGISEYDFLVANAGLLPNEAKQELLAELQQLRQQQPRNGSLWLATGLLLQQLGQYQAALADIEKALKYSAQPLSAGLQKARLLTLLNKTNDALAWLNKLEQSYPSHKGILVLKARILLEQKRLEDARLAFTELQHSFPEDAAILLTLALINDETGHTELARENLYQLLAAQEFTNEAHYYLGRMADRDGLNDLAIEQYSQVSAGKEFLNAQLRATFLTAEEYDLGTARDYINEQKNRYPEFRSEFTRIEVELLIQASQFTTAIAVLNIALAANPDDLELRYSRAMLGERLNNLKLLEQDLKHILSLEKDNVNALNALGYTLADRTERFSEASELLHRAHELSPKNPAIIDSLGWLYFRQGDIAKAKPLLEQAFKLYPDHEIAAHLGELLWLENDHTNAIKVWQRGYKQTPDSRIIDGTLKRLQIDRSHWPIDQPTVQDNE